MDLFKAVPGIRPMIAAMASGMQATCSVYALSGQVPQYLLARRAAELKGSPLTKEEENKINKLHENLMAEIYKRHPELRQSGMVLDITFGLRDVRYLEKNTAECKTPGEVVARIAKWHGYRLEMEYVPELSKAVLWKALTMGIPVVLRQGDNWHVAFGLSGNLVAYDLPADIPLLKTMTTLTHRDMWKAIRSPDTDPEIREAMLRRIRRDYKDNFTITTDFRVNPDAVIPHDGSIVLEEFQESKFAAWFFHSGRESVEAWDPDICRTLGIKPAAPKDF
ncbi:MAG: hypothetical protein N3A66_06250, partial [Planctomycetota bacterium]|nr:hypothetical protein [Planctomycetota bacterium]